MYGNNYFNPQRFTTMQMQGQQVPTQNYMPQMTQTAPSIGLLGKMVESIDVVKAMDIPLDGSISYFPLSDGTAVVSKQLQNDGTSKITIYKPIEQNKKENVRFATFEELQEAINDIDLSDIQELKDEIKDLKKQLKELKTKKSKEDQKNE
jgi:hypothetical protein